MWFYHYITCLISVGMYGILHYDSINKIVMAMMLLKVEGLVGKKSPGPASWSNNTIVCCTVWDYYYRSYSNRTQKTETL